MSRISAIIAPISANQLLELLQKAIPTWGLWLSVSGAIFLSIGPVERFVHPRAKKWIATNLSNPRTTLMYRRLLRAFLGFFDHAFKVKRRGKYVYTASLWRSFISTIIFLTIVLIFLIDRSTSFSDAASSIFSYQSPKDTGSTEPPEFGILYLLEYYFEGGNHLLPLFCFAFAVNILMDYLSICETRIVLRLMFTKSVIMKIFYVVLDLIVTTAIIFVCGYVANVFYDFSVVAAVVILDESSDSFWASFTSETDVQDILQRNVDYSLTSISLCFNEIFSIDLGASSLFEDAIPMNYSAATIPFVMTTYLTSIWIWIYSLSFVLFKLMANLGPLRKFVDFSIGIKEHPFRAVATLSFVAWTSLYWLALHNYGGAGPVT